MANITRIKAGSPAKAEKKPAAPAKTKKVEPKPAAKPKAKAKIKTKKPFILLRPFITLGRYLRDSWREIRQVRWPSRKATWKMFFAVIIYSLFFIVLILLLDIFFEWIFNLILGIK